MLHALLLSIYLLPQGGPVHADLHPRESDVFLEFSDLAALWPAYEQAPLVQVLRNEGIQGMLSGLGMTVDASPKGLVRAGLARAAPGADTGAWLDGLRSISVSLTATGASAEGEAPGLFQAVADFVEPAQAEALKALLVAKAERHEPMTAALGGVERLVVGDEPMDQLWCATVGPRLVIGGGAARVEDFAARADRKAPGLAASERFEQGVAALEKPSGTTVLWFSLARSFLDVARQLEGGETDAEFLSQIPADLIPLAGPRVGRMQMAGNRFVTEMFAAAEQEEPAAKPVQPAWLEPAPSSSMLVYSTAFDGAAFGRRMRELVSKDEASAATIAALEQKLGFGPERVFARLGPALTLYVEPLAGLGLPDTRLWIDCAEPDAFRSDLEALMGALGETLAGYELKTKPYKVKQAGSDEKLEVPVTTLTLPPTAVHIPMISLSPSFAAVGGKLVFGLNSMDVKSELKRVHAGEGEPITPGTSALAAQGFALPAGTCSVLLMDWAKLINGVLGVAKALAGMSGGELPVDLDKLPAPEFFAQQFRPTFYCSRAVPGGMLRRNEASFGPETWAGIFGTAWMLGMRQQQVIQVDLEAEDVAPPVEPPQEGGGR